MKSKKKLLLLGVGAMGALAMGVGATSTFAWYTASVTSTLTAGNHTGTTTATASSTISPQSLEVDFTITQSTASNIVLTDDSGNTKGYINGGVVAGTKGTKDLYGTYSITAAWDSGVTLDQKLAAKDATANFSVSALGNVKLLGSTSPTDVANNSDKKWEYTFTLTVDAAGALQMTAKDAETGYTQKVNVDEGTDTATGYFAVRTNNSNGLEVSAKGGTGTWVASTSYSVGDYVKYSVDNKYYVCKVANSDASWTAGNWGKIQDASGADLDAAPALHAEDEVSIAKL